MNSALWMCFRQPFPSLPRGDYVDVDTGSLPAILAPECDSSVKLTLYLPSSYGRMPGGTKVRALVADIPRHTESLAACRFAMPLPAFRFPLFGGS